MESQPSLEQIWVQQRETILAWLRLGFSLVAVVVVYVDPNNDRLPLLYSVARYSFVGYSVIVLAITRLPRRSDSTQFGLWTTCLDLFWVSLIDFSGGPGTPFFVYYLFPVITASARVGMKGSVVVALIGVIIYATTRFALPSYWSRPFELDAFVVRCMYLLALAYMFGFLSEFEKKQNLKLMALNKTAAEAAIHEERRRVARELHDRLLQVLASLSLRLEASRSHLKGEQVEVAHELEVMEKAAKDSIGEIRSFLAGQLDTDYASGTLVEKIKEEMRFLRDGMGLKMVFESVPEELNLPPAVEKELYLVLREGLLNVARHAHASEAVLSLKARNGELQGILVDDGVGFDEANAYSPKGFGLDNMEERIKKFGGRFSINSIPGRGTRVSFTVPLAL